MSKWKCYTCKVDMEEVDDIAISFGEIICLRRKVSAALTAVYSSLKASMLSISL